MPVRSHDAATSGALKVDGGRKAMLAEERGLTLHRRDTADARRIRKSLGRSVAPQRSRRRCGDVRLDAAEARMVEPPLAAEWEDCCGVSLATIKELDAGRFAEHLRSTRAR